MTTRTFIAVPLEHVALKELAYKVRHIAQKDKAKEIHWIHEEMFHITLDFIGHLPEEQLGELGQNLESELKGVTEFDLIIEGIEYFPSADKPRVVVAMVEESKELEELKIRVDKALAKTGIEAERKRFTPHITVGRPHKHHKLTFQLKRQSMEIQSGVEKIVIYQSVLKKKGAEYSSIKEISLETE